jgi:hypothetical protein
MTAARSNAAMQLLSWTVGLVILYAGWRTFRGSIGGLHAPGHAGVLAWVRLILSGSELLAVPLFLIPVTAEAGGYALLVIIGVVIAIHSLHGEFSGLEILLLYGAAVYASLAWRRERAVEIESHPASK